MLSQYTDLEKLFLEDVPLLDVRAPVEFQQGAFPLSLNLPLLTDSEREAVGICYKNEGQAAAMSLGYSLVKGEEKDRRINQWVEFFKKNPQAKLYCFRGGLRSRITQQWIYESSGLDIPRVTGGYKAMRNYLIRQIEERMQMVEPLVLGGRTGSGKTPFLKALQPHIDLEHHANHKGSAFGLFLTPQPTQINFENNLAIDLIKKVRQPTTLLFEDEGRAIGSVHLPLAIFNRLRTTKLVVIQVSQAERIETIFQEYVIERLEQIKLSGITDIISMANKYLEDLQEKLLRIQRRLGGDRYELVRNCMIDAHKEFISTGNHSLHRNWIEQLLSFYYDPMYDYQLNQRKNNICFIGNPEEVTAYLQENGVRRVQ